MLKKYIIYFLTIILIIILIYNFNTKNSIDFDYIINNKVYSIEDIGYKVYIENNELILERDNIKFIFKDGVWNKVLINNIKTKDGKLIEKFCIEEWNINTNFVENNKEYLRISFYIEGHERLNFLKEYKSSEILKEEIFQFPLHKKYLIPKTSIFASENQTYLTSSSVFTNEVMSLAELNLYYTEAIFLENYLINLPKFRSI